MDVVVWLRSLGLGKYEAAFRENEIDETVLPSLTHENLKELGVTALGHRLKLLDAIATLRSDASDKAPSVDAATASSTPSAHPEDRAERRQVTVMFSDLVGSTALSARMDPEDLREVISAYQKCVAETVGRLGGFVAKYMGDGVLIYFGYPQAHEDDAERAVRAGLELVAAVSNLKTQAPLQTRVGIATGLVVVGDLIGSGASQEQAIVGETPNLAARLQGVAEPNAVVIAESTRKLTWATCSSLKTLGAQNLKGVEGPVPAWAAQLERVAPYAHAHCAYFCSPQRTDSTLYPDHWHRWNAPARLAHRPTPPQAEARQGSIAVLAPTDFDPRSKDAKRSNCRDAVAAEQWTLPSARSDPGRAQAKTQEALTAQAREASTATGA